MHNNDLPAVYISFPLGVLKCLMASIPLGFYSHSFEPLSKFFFLYPQAGVAESVWQSLKSLQQVRVQK
jgi:hypothetical protein